MKKPNHRTYSKKHTQAMLQSPCPSFFSNGEKWYVLALLE